MEHNRIIVIGGSAGAIEPLMGLLSALPGSFSIPIVVVVHTSPGRPSGLARVVGRTAKLSAIEASDGAALEAGHVYFAPSDRHLLVEDGQLRLSKGPRYNRSRPAIDPLFQSAAGVYADRAIGVLLSGALDDGTAGLAAIKAAGGTAILQSPEEAPFKGMIESAQRNVAVDHILPVREISGLLERYAVASAPGPAAPADVSPAIEDTNRQDPGPPSAFTCPDCGGSLWERTTGEASEYVCRVGHGFSPENLFEAKYDGVEAALRMALRALEERADLAKRMALRAEQRKQVHLAERYRHREQEARQGHSALQDFLSTHPPATAEREVSW
jgi:two-component system, chemotaxis family, protein-glutamate methylesterase/glutaminase